MKMTLLEMVQSILSSMDSDDVNSIGDTVESMQVASIVKETYYDIISEREWPFLKKRIHLEHGGDLGKPTTLFIPDNVAKVYNVFYNGKEVEWMEPECFIKMLLGRNTSLDEVEGDGFFNDRDPKYYTAFDDDTITCDSWNSDEGDTLMSSRTDSMVLLMPQWEMVDDFYPLLPARAFPALLADAKGTAFINLKQQANAKEEAKARRGRVMMQSEVWRVNDATPKSNKLINYGR